VLTESGAGQAVRRRRAARGQGDLLRAEIVEAASRMLAVSGAIGELSLRAVAREVGVAATSIYLHFGKLDELIMAVKIRYFEEFGGCLNAAAEAAGGTALNRAQARAHEYVRYGMANPGIYWVMFSSEMLPLNLLGGAVYIGAEVFEAVRDEIGSAARPGDDSYMLAVHFWTALHGMVTLRTVRRNFPWPDIDHEIDDLIARLLPDAS
jgi:AcrR family transcriptional regulator